MILIWRLCLDMSWWTALANAFVFICNSRSFYTKYCGIHEWACIVFVHMIYIKMHVYVPCLKGTRGQAISIPTECQTLDFGTMNYSTSTSTFLVFFWQGGYDGSAGCSGTALHQISGLCTLMVWACLSDISMWKRRHKIVILRLISHIYRT